ncbi:MAG: methyltransferase domain-containing protein [Chloroflexota bacterium]
MKPLLLSKAQAEIILQASRAKRTIVDVSLDLGKTLSQVELDANAFSTDNSAQIPFDELKPICDAPQKCFIYQDEQFQQIRTFSEEDNKVYSLMPTKGAPTLLVSGISMHRIKNVDPNGDARLKVKAVAPVKGNILDTATGLGYTAIQAAKTAEHVTTIEISPSSLEMARLNPWSDDLFENPNIHQIVGDSYEVVQTFTEAQFSRVVHDPPSFSVAGELYSDEFYEHLYRILQPRGRLYHYIGDLDSKAGRNTAIATGAIRRLKSVGFKRVDRRKNAFGLVAFK